MSYQSTNDNIDNSTGNRAFEVKSKKPGKIDKFLNIFKRDKAGDNKTYEEKDRKKTEDTKHTKKHRWRWLSFNRPKRSKSRNTVEHHDLFVSAKQRNSGLQIPIQEISDGDVAQSGTKFQAPRKQKAKSTTLPKSFYTKPQSFPSPKRASSLGPTTTTHMKETTALRQPVVGLVNFGTSCFFNAVMQNLNQTGLLRDTLKVKEPKEIGPLTQSLVKFYSRMSDEVQKGSQKAVNPTDLFDSICKRSNKFKSGQCDSHELLRHLLDGLRIEERQASGSADNRKTLTDVDGVFGGHFMTVYVCEKCQQDVGQNKSLFGEAKTDYQKAMKRLMKPLCEVNNAQTESLDQQRNSRKHKPYSVEDCLEAFTRTDYISDEYLCAACSTNHSSSDKTDYRMTSATKRTLVYNPPAILTLHLKRFKQTDRGFVKCNEHITFEEALNLGPYCSSFGERNKGNDTSIWYSLYGLVEHSGSLNGGHYVAYVKTRQNDDDIKQFVQETFLDRDLLTEVAMIEKMQANRNHNPIKEWEPQSARKGTWFRISDSHCRKVKLAEVLDCQAYLLFYERFSPTGACTTRRSTSSNVCRFEFEFTTDF